MTQPQRNKFEMAAHDVDVKGHYHDKKYPHTVTVRLKEEQYNKIKKAPSEIIRTLINLAW